MTPYGSVQGWVIIEDRNTQDANRQIVAGLIMLFSLSCDVLMFAPDGRVL
jgi:hypothetical protein